MTKALAGGGGQSSSKGFFSSPSPKKLAEGAAAMDGEVTSSWCLRRTVNLRLPTWAAAALAEGRWPNRPGTNGWMIVREYIIRSIETNMKAKMNEKNSTGYAT